MKFSFWIYVFSTTILFGCGGGGGNPGVCSGSGLYCADAAGTSSVGTIGSGTTATPLFSKSGNGDAVFDLPARVTRIRIQGNLNANSSNFIVKIAGQLVVNEIIEISSNVRTFDGTYLLVGGGTVEITGSSGVSWTFTEVTAEKESVPTNPYSKSGTGDNVFDLPSRVTRIRIQGNLNGNSSNFIVKIAGQLVVNEILKTSTDVRTFDGTYSLVGGGTVEIIGSSGISWTFSEVK